MSHGTMSAVGGAFATSRRGGIDQYEAAFIKQKRAAGFPISAIARMLGRPVAEVAEFSRASDACAAQRLPVAIAKPADPPQPSKREWRVWKDWSRVKRGRELPTKAKAITQAVAEKHGLTIEHLTGEGRSAWFARARHEAFYELRQTKRYSLSQIGSWFGGRDHTTVMNGVIRHEARMAQEGMAA